MYTEAFSIAGHEEVRLFVDPATGLKALIVVHRTRNGLSIGGCRFVPGLDVDQAFLEAITLSKATSDVMAMGNLPLGGGQALIFGDRAKVKTPAMLRAFGKALAMLDGRLWLVRDTGMTRADFKQIRIECGHLLDVGQPVHKQGGAPSLGLVDHDLRCVARTGERQRLSGHDLDVVPMQSLFTSIGVYMGMRTCLRWQFGSGGFAGKTIAVQGLGRVGMALASLLRMAGATVIGADINPQRCMIARQRLGIETVDPDEIMALDVDLLAPCASGQVLDETNIDRVQAAIVAGSASNQLADTRMGSILAGRHILYAPDFVINAGGMICAAHQLLHGPRDSRVALNDLKTIPRRLKQIFKVASTGNLSTQRVAECLATELAGNAGRGGAVAA